MPRYTENTLENEIKKLKNQLKKLEIKKKKILKDKINEAKKVVNNLESELSNIGKKQAKAKVAKVARKTRTPRKSRVETMNLIRQVLTKNNNKGMSAREISKIAKVSYQSTLRILKQNFRKEGERKNAQYFLP